MAYKINVKQKRERSKKRWINKIENNLKLADMSKKIRWGTEFYSDVGKKLGVKGKTKKRNLLRCILYYQV